MHRGVARILLLQAVLAGAAAVVMIALRPGMVAPILAAAFGGAMALVNTLLLARRTRQAGAVGGNTQFQTMGLMFGVVERFVFTLVTFALGMGLLGLDALALLIGFAAAQMGYLVAGVQAQMGGVDTAGPARR